MTFDILRLVKYGVKFLNSDVRYVVSLRYIPTNVCNIQYQIACGDIQYFIQVSHLFSFSVS